MIRVKKKFIHENIIYFYNHVSGLQHVQYKIILNILKIHADGHTQTAGNGKKNGKKSLIKKPKNKTTRSTLQLGSNTAARCDINLFTQASF